ncbi:hypothetical protein J7438_10155 [Thalassotalea sp. G20_0]|uniref:hypothetical protein n=1 Tax=Thalassotalea sp. G20_0 TaxID=2821093 RepID=UPI001ADC7FA6|nr:hypothetical protein [Thalassotalea sp. G20_0]MBO9494446.1 hypothetical protein [Thalassotalea sp. G20_0]
MNPVSYLPPSSTSELSQETNAVTPKHVDEAKTIGLDNPETCTASAKPLAAYSIDSSDDEFEGDDNGILKLKTDNYQWVAMNRNAQAVGRISLCLVHVPDDGRGYLAWHMDPGDLNFILNPNTQLPIMLMMEYCPSLIIAPKSHAHHWKENVQINPGTTYLCGPDADEYESVQDFFNVDPANVVRTEKDPVSVTFDIATRSFHTNYHGRHSQS